MELSRLLQCTSLCGKLLTQLPAREPQHRKVTEDSCKGAILVSSIFYLYLTTPINGEEVIEMTFTVVHVCVLSLRGPSENSMMTMSTVCFSLVINQSLHNFFVRRVAKAEH